MELINEFDVKVPVDEAWTVLTDVERIAPCLPGAQLKEVEGDEYRGIVKVKVGPISAQYSGTATFVERDDVAHRAVLDAKGRDTRGQGNANARITAELSASGDDSTHVVVTTDLTITGKVAQFGRGVLADVSSKLMTQFVENLETTVIGAPEADASDPLTAPEALAGEQGADTPEGSVEAELQPPSEPATGAASPSSGVRLIDSPEAEPIDLLDSAGTPVVKRMAPLLGVALVAFVLWRVLRRRG
jgi:carbon monoxide dehydrogenase subunit G